VAGQWFSLGTPVSSTNKTDRHDIAENVVESGIKHHNPLKNKLALILDTILIAKKKIIYT
jgi:hypothetical protein